MHHDEVILKRCMGSFWGTPKNNKKKEERMQKSIKDEMDAIFEDINKTLAGRKRRLSVKRLGEAITKLVGSLNEQQFEDYLDEASRVLCYKFPSPESQFIRDAILMGIKKYYYC